MESRTAVLLGAGASAEAGLPLTSALAEKIVSRANDGRRYGNDRSGAVAAINFVYGSMVGFQAEDGSNPLRAVNIERLISAVRLLKDAQNHEVAPFVASWRKGARGVGAPLIGGSLTNSVRRALSESLSEHHHFAADHLASAIGEIARAAMEGNNPRSFEVAEDIILADLSNILGSVESVEYLTPLAAFARVQRGGLDILTLNYDLTIEKMAAQEGVFLDRGIERWVPGRPLAFKRADARINLIKLHGSLDWVRMDRTTAMAPPRIVTDTPRPGDEDDNEGNAVGRSRRPWIVVGEREKLATDGPTLALLRAAEDALLESQHLLVVGYSFNDTHINAIIRDWLFGDVKRTLGIIEKNWVEVTSGDFVMALLREYGFSDRPTRASRVLPLQGSTGERLQEGLAKRPELEPDVRLEASYDVLEGGIAMVKARLHGADLYDVSVTVRQDNPDEANSLARSRSFNTHNDLSDVRHDEYPAYNAWRAARIAYWHTGDEVVVYSTVPDPQGALDVHGRRADAASQEYITTELALSGSEARAINVLDRPS